MKFDKIIQRLLPHDESFYKFFEEASNPLVTERIYKRFMDEGDGGGEEPSHPEPMRKR